MARNGHDPKKNNPRIIFWPQKWSVIHDPNHFLSHDPWSAIRIIFSAVIRNPWSKPFLVWSEALRINSSVFSDDDNIADQGSFLRITDHFCGLRIIFADRGSFCGLWIVWCSRKMIRKVIRQQNAFDPIYFIRSVIRDLNHFRINDL